MPADSMFDLLQPHPEPSSLVAYAGNRSIASPKTGPTIASKRR